MSADEVRCQRSWPRLPVWAIAGLSFAFSLGAYGCAMDRSEGPDTSEQARPIINGVPDTSAAHQAVVAVLGPASLCSGTLVASREVLTAAHCVDGLVPADLQVYFGNDLSQPGQVRNVSEIAIHPAYTDTPAVHDIAMIRLSTAAPGGVTPIGPMHPNQAYTPANIGGSVVFVGFGQDELAQSGVKLTITRPLAVICTGPEECIFGAGGVASPKTLGFETQPGGPCSGDSGGPGLRQIGATEFVVQVNSYVDLNCQVYSVGARVTAYWYFIRNFIQGSNNEVCEGGVDEDGDGAIDCADPNCDTDPSCIGANWTTADFICNNVTHPCPDGSSCTTVNIPNWPAGAGICSPDCAQPNAPNDECYETVSGIGYCSITDGTNWSCALYCGSVIGESCPTGFTCRNSSTGAPNPQQGVCVPDFAVSEGGLCGNGIDDDNDGQTDCDDTDCDGAATCATPEVCGNGGDDDGDGLIDCVDPDCFGEPVCVDVETDCVNGIDDDGDGDTDCADSECAVHFTCGGTETDCRDSLDNDRDGATDCADPDCQGSGDCGAVELGCNDGLDNDNDGDIDCDDSDCVALGVCGGGLENCVNGIDDNLDGLTDCNDPQCSDLSFCRQESGCSCEGASSSGGSAPALIFFLLIGLWLRRRSAAVRDS